MNEMEPGQPNESVTFLGSFSKKLVANTFFNLFGRFWNFLAVILLTPYILKHLTVGEFGTWAILSVFISSFSLLDLGLGSAFVKFISTYHTRREYDKIDKVLFSGLVFYAVHGVLLVAGGLLIQSWLFGFFDLTGAASAYLLVLLAAPIGNMGAMFLSVFRGIQRMDISNAIEMGMSVVNFVGTLLVLQWGMGLTGLALTALTTSVISLIVSVIAVHRAVIALSLGFHFDRKILAEMSRYGAQIVVSRIGGVVCFELDKLIVAKFLGVATVSFYKVSAQLAAAARAVPLNMMSALIPATSELGARNDKEKIIRTYVIASKYVALVTVAVVAFLVVSADPILRLWLGDGFEQSVILVQLLAIGYGANVLVGAASQTGAGVGRPEFDMRSTVLLSTLSPILGLLLVQRFGAPGAAAGTALALAAAAGYLLVAFHRNYLHTSVLATLREIHARPIVSGVLAVLAVRAAERAVPAVGWMQALWYSIPAKLALDFAIFSFVYVAVLIALRQITVIDWKNFVGLMSFGVECLRHPFRERVKIYR